MMTPADIMLGLALLMGASFALGFHLGRRHPYV